ncbi:histidine kinase [Paenibacillus sp. P25]|nr:histidine kinase [Paenibacillus sp. P25]
MLALQSQIRPHFIYNTLNVIKWMAKIQGAKGIEDALTAFSGVIRFTAKTESDYVTIREEVEFLRVLHEDSRLPVYESVRGYNRRRARREGV